MNRLASFILLVPIMALLILSPSLPPAYATPTYAAGVVEGQWATYAPVNVTYHGTGLHGLAPQNVIDLNKTAMITGTVKQVSSTYVTIQEFTQYKNSTTQTALVYGDLLTGVGNVTFGLVAGGLSRGGHLWAGQYTPTINQTVSLSFLGVSRAANILNITYRQPFERSYITVSQEYVWDQTSGIALESKNLSVYPASTIEGGFVEYSDVKIQATNIYANPNSPDFTITASSPGSVTTGTSAASTITVASVKGFSQTVTLTDTVPLGLICNPITPSTLLAYGTANLSCSSTTPGTYAVTITATSGPTTRTTTTVMTVTAPAQAPNAAGTIPGLSSTLSYVIIGIILAAIAAIGAYTVLRSRSERQEKT
jgi:hypothetical protein